MGELNRESVFGVSYVCSNLEESTNTFIQLAEACEGVYLVAHSDVHLLTRILNEPEYAGGLKTFDYICPDGMPIVWLMRHKGTNANRLCGSDVMETMFDKGRPAGLRHFLLGGSEEACALLQQTLENKYPGVVIAGHYCPPMGDWPAGTNEQMIQAVKDSGANCVWVGLGCPKQERWLYTYRQQLPPAVYFGVGAAFNFISGVTKRAPKWMQKMGLEWLYRFCCEPRRLFRRIFVHCASFLWYCLTKKI